MKRFLFVFFSIYNGVRGRGQIIKCYLAECIIIYIVKKFDSHIFYGLRDIAVHTDKKTKVAIYQLIINSVVTEMPPLPFTDSLSYLKTYTTLLY